VKLYDAGRCPYCARVRIALAEKGLAWETVEIDLSARPPSLYELNSTGRVPVLDDMGFVLPESAVILEYLDERFPEPALLPQERGQRAEARLAVYRFDDALGDDYYAFRRGDANELDAKLAQLDLGSGLFVAAAYAPWVIRAREMLDVSLPLRLELWLERLAERLAFARELELVAAL